MMSINLSFPDSLISQIAQWLDQRRIDICDRAPKEGLPLVVKFYEPIAISVEDSYNLSVEERLVSPVSNSLLSNPYWQLIQPILNIKAQDIAKELVELAGENIRFHPLSLAGNHREFIKNYMQNPELLDEDKDELMFYGLLLLRQCLSEYLKNLSSLDSANMPKAIELASQLIEFASSDTVDYVCRVPIGGINIEDEIGSNDVIIKPLTLQEVAVFYKHRMPNFDAYGAERFLPIHLASPSYLFETAMLEISKQVLKKDNYQDQESGFHSKISLYVEHLIIALQLLGFELTGIGRGAVLRKPFWIDTFAESLLQSLYPLAGLSPPLTGEGKTITKTDLEKAIHLVNAIENNFDDKQSKIVNLAISRFGLALNRGSHEDSILDYVIALEALLLRGNNQELGLRFALNGAVLTESDPSNRQKPFEDFKDIYNIRSAIVHGALSEKQTKQLPDLVKKSKNATRDVLKKVLEDGLPTQEYFLELLLEKNYF